MVFSIVSPTNGSETVNMATNVGGVIGAITNKNSETTNQIEILNINNLSDIEGYQNVGGLIGFVNVEAGTILLSTYKEGNNNETENTETKVVENINNAEIYGVINVGGAVGLVDSGKNAHNASITNTTNKANVYGNANVGGLVGYNNQGVITNNKVTNINDEQNTNTKEATLAAENSSSLLVKGIVYQAVLKDNVQLNYVPSNVGGLIGFGVNSQVKDNNLNNVLITSTEEGINNTVISTISNHMVETIDESGQLNGGVTDKNSTLQLVGEDNKIAFNNIKSGYGLLMGGTFGGINKSATEESTKQNANNIITDSNISAKLGVNVGTLFGYYSYLKLANETLPPLMSQIEGVVTLASTQQQNANLNVDGAYNIGGIFGYLDNNTPVTLQQNIETQVLTSNNKIKVTLQANSTGMYVGGLVGKMNGTSGDVLKISSNSGNVSIQIDTTNSYYMGGLVGRYEVGSEGANFNGHVGDYTFNEKHEVQSSENTQITTSAITELNSISEFGGLIGMLKVAYTGDSVSTTINGYHQYAFTINTIENSNYYDGPSTYKASVGNGEHYLMAQATYMNMDDFKISSTNNKEWYSKNTKGEFPNNPLISKKSRGWAKDYTMFKTMQRNIPALTENNKNSLNSGTAEWDAISPVYDATFITYVATIENLGLSGQVTVEDKTYEDDYLCFTIYEEFTGQAKLYSAIGVASPYYNDKGDYDTPKDERTDDGGNWWKWGLAYLGFASTPGGHYYIDLGNNTNGLNGLVNLPIQNDKTNKYKTVGKNEHVLQGFAGDKDSDPIVVDYAYCVKDYQQMNNEEENKTKKANTWFVFGLIYDKDQKAQNGSIFAVNGNHTSDVDEARISADNPYGYVKWVSLAIDVIITIATFGAGGIMQIVKAGGKMALAVGMAAIKAQAKKMGAKLVTKTIFKFGKKAAFKFIKRLVKVAVVHAISGLIIAQYMANSIAQSNYFSVRNQSIGYLAPSYSREVRYKDNIMLTQTDATKTFGDKEYVYYSTIRPSDYFENRYYLEWPNVDYDNITEEELDNIIDKVSEGDPKLKFVKGSDGDITTNATYNDKPCIAYNYYEYKNGIYYKIMDDLSIDIIPVQPYFNNSLLLTSDYIMTNGYYYVRGKYNNDNNYSFATNFNNKQVVIDDEAFDNINLTATTTKELSFVPVTQTKEGDNIILANEFIVKPNTNYISQQGELSEIQYYLGYGYMKGVYYTADGTNFGNNFVKYGTFTKEEARTTDGLEQNADYIQIVKDGETYNYYLDTVSNDLTSGSVHDIDSIPNNLDLDNTPNIVIRLYPKSFADPYKGKTKAYDDDLYCIENSLLNTTGGIKQNVEYYYFDGGYDTINGESFEDDEGQTQYEQIVVCELDKTEPKDDEEKTKALRFEFYNLEGESKLVSCWELYNNYTTYESWFITFDSTEEEDKVGNNYFKENDKLYMRTDYVLYGGVLSKISLNFFTNEAEKFNYNYNKYLSDSSHQIYTRYKYDKNLVMADFMDEEDSYSIYKENRNFPNYGTTYLVESVRVILSGGSAFNNGTNSSNEKAGNIQLA